MVTLSRRSRCRGFRTRRPARRHRRCLRVRCQQGAIEVCAWLRRARRAAATGARRDDLASGVVGVQDVGACRTCRQQNQNVRGTKRKQVAPAVTAVRYSTAVLRNVGHPRCKGMPSTPFCGLVASTEQSRNAHETRLTWMAADPAGSEPETQVTAVPLQTPACRAQSESPLHAWPPEDLPSANSPAPALLDGAPLTRWAVGSP